MPKRWLKIWWLLCLFCLQATVAHAWKMESGEVDLGSTSGQTQLFSFTFQQTYDTPPVVVALMRDNGSHPSALRINNVSTTGFQMAQVEPFSEDGPHTSLTVTYIAIEPGVHTLPDGRVIEAGSVATAEQQFNGIPSGQKGWEGVSFSHAFANPILLADIQTINNEPGLQPRNTSHPWLTVAVDSLTGSGVDLAIERSEAYDSTSGPNYRFNNLASSESIGYMVMEANVSGNFTVLGNRRIDYESRYVFNAADGWDNGCDAINYTGSYDTTPLAVATKSSHIENDGGWLRQCSNSSSSIQLTVDEDEAQDSERNHLAEDVSLLVFSDAFIYDSNATGASGSEALMLEANTISLPANQYTSITFQQVYDQIPAVFVLGDDGNPEPSSVRIRNVTTTGFEAIPVEPESNYVDASDQSTVMHYLVVTYGEFQFPDGTRIEVGQLPLSNYQARRLSGSSWFSFNYLNAFPSTPAVLAQIQTMNNEPAHSPGDASSPWLEVTLENISSSGADIALERAETITGTISQNEDVAYLAVERGVISDFRSITGDIVSAEALQSSNQVAGTTSCDTVNFSQAYPSPPLVVGNWTTRNGGEGGWLRRCSTTTTDVDVKIEEDWAQDKDGHTNEYVDLMVFSQAFAADFSLLANYQLEGTSWNGTAGEVEDVSHYDYDGRALNGTLSVQASSAIAGNPGTCRYGVFDDAGSSDGNYIELSNFPDLTSDFTITAWFRTQNRSAAGQRIFADDLGPGYAVSLGDPGAGRLRFYSRNVSPVSMDTPAIIDNDRWYFVAAVADITNSTRTLYVYDDSGTLINTTQASYTGTWGTDPGAASIGGEIAGGETGNRFNGNIDEVRVYSRALSSGAIDTIRTLTHPCDITLDHYGIATNGTGVTCEASPVTITAYQSDGSTIAPPSGTTISITTTPNGDGWAIDTGSPPPGSFSPGGSGSASYEFSGTESSVVLYLQRGTPTGATPVNIDVSDGFQSEDAGKDDDLAFVDTGFIFDGDPATAGTQLLPSQVSAASDSFAIRAVRTDTESGACVARLSGVQDVEFAYECRDPAACKLSQHVNIAGTDIDGNASGSVSAYEPVSINFDASGSASFSYHYDDAGLIRLHARKALAASGVEPAITLSGSSNEFVHAPAGFCVEAVDASASCSAPYHNCSRFRDAGEAFDLRIKAVAWESAGETHTDFCTGNATTPNFELSNLPLNLSLIAPSAGSNGTLGVTSINFASADNGEVLINNQSVSEVGAFAINLNASAQSYQGESLTDSTSATIGRFSPDHLRVSLAAAPVFRDAEAPWSCAFTYQDQSFSYLVDPAINVTAYNASDQITRNYGGDFWKLASTWSNRSYADQAAAAPGLLVDTFAGSVTYTEQTDYDGDGEASLSGDLFTYAKANMTPAASDAPFDADVNLTVSTNDLTDNDGVCVQSGASGTCTEYTFSNIVGTQLRYGRAKLDNAFGPETGPLNVPMQVQFYDGNRFVTNTADDCSVYTSSLVSAGGSFEFLSYSGALSSGDTDAQVGGTPGAGATFSAGSYVSGQEIELTTPSVTGSTVVRHRVPLWLKYDWNSDGDLADDEDHPSSEVSFGQYRGHDRIIYWREVFD